MNTPVSRIAVATLMGAVLLIPSPSAAGPSVSPQDDLLRLARLADAVYDQQPSWLEESRRLPDLAVLAEHIAGYVEEEGYGGGRVPAAITMAGDFGSGRSLEAGRYYPATDTIELNGRYITDPTWAERPWLGVIIHEMLHGEGYAVEPQVQLISLEILATMANDGYPGAMHELTDRVRRHALLSAWWLAAFEHDELPTRLSTTNTFTDCDMGCTQVDGDVAIIEEQRRSIYDAAELRQVLSRERFWLTRSERDYDVVLGAYVAEPLWVALVAACGDGLGDQLSREGSPPPLFPSTDDVRAFLLELGWC